MPSLKLPALSRRHSLLIGLGAASVAVYAALAGLPGLRGPFVPHFLALYTLAFALYSTSALVVSRESSWQRTLLIAGAAAIAMRAVLWGTVPSLSDDVYRYLWDGRLLTNGVSPYAFRVDSPALDYLATPNRALVNNAWMASPYFPAAQGLFGLVTLLAPESTLAFQIVISLVDLLTGALIATLLFRLGRNPALSLLYLWNPLVVVEFAHGAHVDAWMLALLLAGLVALLGARLPDRHDRRAYWAAPVLLGLASLVKPLPLFLGPVLAWRLGVRRLVVWGIVVVALSAPFVALNGLGLAGPADGVGLLGATRIYTNQWNYNGGLYHWLEVLTTGNAVPWGARSNAPGAQAARLISGFVFLGTLAVLGWTARKADTGGLLRRCLLAMGSYLLLTTTVHPWYLTAVLALVPLAAGNDKTARPDWWPGLPWIWFSYAVAWSYLTYVGEFREFPFVRNLEYLPTLALLLFPLLKLYLNAETRAIRDAF
jgi:hypothetical protein